MSSFLKAPPDRAFVDELLATAAEEGLHLEFKTLERPDNAVLTKNDRKTLASAITGLSNASGGLVVIGIRTAKPEGLDVAVATAPLAQASILRNRLASALPDLLDPPRPDVLVHFVPIEPGEPAGFLVVDVPVSDRRPHMAMPERCYYRRGSDSTRRMDNGEVRDLMLALREASLELVVDAAPNVSMSHVVTMYVTLGLRNTSDVPVRAPYLRVVGGDDVQLHEDVGSMVALRSKFNGARSFVTGRDFIVHPDDDVRFVRIPSGLAFHDPARTAFEQAADVMAGRGENFTVGPGLSARAAFDRTFELSIDFGAENVRRTTLPPRFFGRGELFRLMQPYIR